MIKYINWFLNSYDFNGIRDFAFSLIPSAKYGLQIPSLSLSAIVAVMGEWFGFGPVIALAMLIAVSVEVFTGIRASRVRGEDFESFKFSRCVIKTFIWLACIFIIHSFYSEFKGKEDWLNILSAIFMSIVKIFVMVFFVLEHVTSILENLAVIDGKPKDALVKKVQIAWDVFTELLTHKIK